MLYSQIRRSPGESRLLFILENRGRVGGAATAVNPSSSPLLPVGSLTPFPTQPKQLPQGPTFSRAGLVEPVRDRVGSNERSCNAFLIIPLSLCRTRSHKEIKSSQSPYLSVDQLDQVALLIFSSVGPRNARRHARSCANACNVR